ncbi:MAG: DUF2254 domain-containing protein [Burkholderiaceae bacterium]|nr:DUF2254 domain-containing protein [Burkholderiaceae bacterium]
MAGPDLASLSSLFSRDTLRFVLRRIRERLWVKPLFIGILSVVAVFLAKLSDHYEQSDWIPVITTDSVQSLLSVMAASMLPIAMFAVASMVSAYSSASNTATPRSFPLVISDDVSQNALSAFMGAFIFSVVALTASKNQYFEGNGRFTLFSLTLLVLAFVIFTFVRWVDRIARLGRLGTTVDQAERATAAVMRRRRDAPTLGGVLLPAGSQPAGDAVFADEVGYVQRIDMEALQAFAKKTGGTVVVHALPGAFALPGRALAFYTVDPALQEAVDPGALVRAFRIGGDRLFDDDPRFGLVVLAEIAGRALSPAVNDPGTAIDIVGTLTRLFVLWNAPGEKAQDAPRFDRVHVPLLEVAAMFDDAFTPIARDGAACVEVGVRLQKAFFALGLCGDDALRDAALRHARLALARAEQALTLPEDLNTVRDFAAFALQSGQGRTRSAGRAG